MFSTDKENRIFKIASWFVIFITCWVTYKLGFSAMIKVSNISQERLRDITFPVWNAYSFLKHGFLVFINPGDFEAKIAYSSHSTPYLIYMKVLYHIEMLVPKLSMRLTSAVLEMLAIATLIINIGYTHIKGKIQIQQWALFVLGMVYMATMPTYWIATGKFNVDNQMHFFLACLILMSYRIAYFGCKGRNYWIMAIVYSIANPFAAVLTGMFMITKAFNWIGEKKSDFIKGGIGMLVLGMAAYMQRVLTAKLLGFSSINSGWLFRSGLDGSTDYYTNILNSILNPFFTRPAYLLYIPALFVAVQLIYKFKINKENEAEKTEPFHLFLQILFSQYVLMLVFWPQAVSVHPYLYDDLLVIPLGVWVAMNFAVSTKFQKHFNMWFWILITMVTFNLTQIAQAAYSGVRYYPIIQERKI